ncbi:MAG: CrcB family protein [Deltaproteobacteria bacterium]|nr:CrcB family protein [Deltaproteobacteria bacterium]
MTASVAALLVAGALGTAARSAVVVAVARVSPGFPSGTIVVNLVGSLLFGVVWGATEGLARESEVRLALLTGFLGAFTTFSTLAFDTLQLAASGRAPAAVGSALGQLVVGVVLAGVGLAVGRTL